MNERTISRKSDRDHQNGNMVIFFNGFETTYVPQGNPYYRQVNWVNHARDDNTTDSGQDKLNGAKSSKGESERKLFKNIYRKSEAEFA